MSQNVFILQKEQENKYVWHNVFKAKSDTFSEIYITLFHEDNGNFSAVTQYGKIKYHPGNRHYTVKR